MIEEDEIFEAVRRGYNDLAESSDEDIYEYFQNVEIDSFDNHVSHIKGILFEQEYIEKLEIEGIQAEIFEATNYPVTDIAIIEDGEIVNELQLKATESVSYINATLEENPDIMIVATSEVASQMNNEMVINSGISESILEDSIIESISPIPLSPIGICIGLFTGFFF